MTGQLPYPTPRLPDDPVAVERRMWLFDELHRTCAGLVDAIARRLPEPDRERVRTGLHVGEWLFLLDDLCAALIQERIAVTPAERDRLAAAMVLAGSDPDTGAARPRRHPRRAGDRRRVTGETARRDRHEGIGRPASS
jgi:hypothetical protein